MAEKKKQLCRALKIMVMMEHTIMPFLFSYLGAVAAGYLQAKPEAATWTLLSGRQLHLLCIEGNAT